MSAARTLAFVLLVWLLWRGGSAALALARELDVSWEARGRACSVGTEERLELTLAARDHKLGLPTGYQAALWKAVDQHVPPFAQIRLVGPLDNVRGRALLPILTVGRPRAIVREVLLAPDVGPAQAEDWLLVFAPEFEPLGKERRASGPDWSLWR